MKIKNSRKKCQQQKNDKKQQATTKKTQGPCAPGDHTFHDGLDSLVRVVAVEQLLQGQGATAVFVHAITSSEKKKEAATEMRRVFVDFLM